MRRVFGVMAGLIVVAFAAVVAAGHWRPQRVSSFSGSVRDAERQFVQRAQATGRDDDGSVVVQLALVGAKWTVIEEQDSEWGRRIATLEIDAPGCEFATHAARDRTVHGSPYSHLSPHPNTYRVEWSTKADNSSCPENLPLDADWADRLATELADDDLLTRWAARHEVRRLEGRIAPFDQTLWRALRGSLDHLPADEHPQVLATFGAFGSTAAAGVHLVAALLDDPEPGVRRLAVATLDELGGAVPGVIDALARALADSEPTVVVDAAAAISRASATATPDATGAAESALISLLESEGADLRSRRAAFAALHTIGSSRAREVCERWAGPLSIAL